MAKSYKTGFRIAPTTRLLNRLDPIKKPTRLPVYSVFNFCRRPKLCTDKSYWDQALGSTNAKKIFCHSQCAYILLITFDFILLGKGYSSRQMKEN